MAVRTIDDYMKNVAWVTRVKGSLISWMKIGVELKVVDFTIMLGNFNREVKSDSSKVYKNLHQVYSNRAHCEYRSNI